MALTAVPRPTPHQHERRRSKENMKTARFTEVVATAGPPQVHSLWVAPGQDPALKRAVRDCRVMTIHQMLRGTQKDYGTVGLQADQSSQILVFPKSLRRFSDVRIVGIDYSLVMQPDPKDPAPPFVPPKSKARKSSFTPAQRTGGAAIANSRALPPKPGFTRDELLAEIRRAVRELKAGKAVAAYERLSGLIDAE